MYNKNIINRAYIQQIFRSTQDDDGWSAYQKTYFNMSQTKYNFQSDLKQTIIPKGLNEDVIKHISNSKNEPKWLLEFRLKAYKHWKNQNDNKKFPDFTKLKIPQIDFQNISYLATIKKTTDLVELKKEWIELL